MTLLPDKDWLLARVKHGRSGWAHAKKPAREPVGPGEESVWDFPRPPQVEPVSERLRVMFAGIVIADTTRGLRVLETAGAPVYHFPPQDVSPEHLRPTGRVTVCEWKGAATYFDVVAGDRIAREAAYTYPDPLDDLGMGYRAMAGWPVFYASRVDAVFIGDTQASAQPGGYYAGWVTPRLKGPIKGEPGSEGW